MTGIEQFEEQTYLNLKTYRKNGEAMPTPVWFVQDGKKLYVRTIAASGKVKRINNNPDVQVMPCGRMGEPLGSWIPARAQELNDQGVFDHVKALLVTKYGEMVQTLEDQAHQRGQSYTVLLLETGDLS